MLAIDRKVRTRRARRAARDASPARLKPCVVADAVGEELQRALRGHRRIDLAHRAGGGIARIDEEPSGRPPAGARSAPRNRAASCRPRRALRGPRADACQREPRGIARIVRTLRRHVLADLAVAARRRHGQLAVLVAQADRETVELELGRVLDRRRIGREPQIAAHARVELRGGFGDVVSVSVRIDSIGTAWRTGANSRRAARRRRVASASPA